MILVNGNIKVHGTPSKLKRDYGVGYKIIINKSNDQTNDIENQLRPHLRELTIERDTSGGDIVICTNEKMSSHFVDALEKLEAMKEAKQIRNYGVQNSSMEDVFLKIVRDAGETDQSETTTINIEQIASQCRHVLNNRQLESDFKFYLSQFYGLAIKTIRVRYRRWGLAGAGKTTTFRIVVGELMATEGMAFIGGQNVCRRRLTSTCHLGYCPQQNCSMDFLTVRDSLYLFARIRGVPRERIDSMVSNMISLFLLDEYVNNYTHQLSGGTKRRLHAAIALIGPPLVAILDEPTTGVDPYAQQQIQEVLLNAVKSQMTIILTSHSMDECERVCNRLGIMESGQLACLGTIQHLKSKFRQGYTINIELRSEPNNQSPLSFDH
ncbi:unnamed protein product, partial [Rotaria sordida]